MAQCGIVGEIGEEAHLAMDRNERGGKLCDLAARYENEFMGHGLDRECLASATQGEHQ